MQVRFGHKDLEVLLKTRGSNEPFRLVNLRDFVGTETLPEFDHDLVWRNHKDRPPRRRVTSSRSSSPNVPRTKKLIRNLSIGSQDKTVNKRSRTDRSSDSSSASDTTSGSDTEMNTDNTEMNTEINDPLEATQ